MTFLIYKKETGGVPLWMEIQNVHPDASGRYRVLLGSATSGGLPAELFAPDELRWIGVRVESNPELPRSVLVSVPYALKAEEAQRLDGRNATEFVSVEQLKDTVRREIQDQVSTKTALAIASPEQQAAAQNPGAPSGGTLSLKDFGAKGDGKTDDTGAIQAALSAVNTGAGGTLFAPCGTYLIHAGLTLKGALDPDRSIRIEGESWSCVIFKATAGSFSMFTLGTFAQLEDISLDGDGQPGVNGIYYYGGSYSLVRDVRITRVDKGVYLAGSNAERYGVFYAVLNRVRITNPVYGIYISTADDGSDWVNQNQFYSCRVQGAAADAVYVNGGSGNSFYGLDVEGNNFGFRLLRGQSTTISGAWFEKNKMGPLYIAYTSRTSGSVISAMGLTEWAGLVSTTGSIGAGSPELTVASAVQMVPGKVITIVGAGASGQSLVTTIVSVAGNTVTLATPASTTVGPNAAVTGPSFVSNSSHFVSDGRNTHMYGKTTVDALEMGPGATSSYYFNRVYGGYQAFETPGTTLYQVNYGANVEKSYWRNSKGNVLLALETASGNLTLSGSLRVGGGAPLKTTDQTGTGNLVLANQPTLYGGYRALETPGTNLYQVNYGANVEKSYWRNSKGNDLLTLDTASGNLTLPGSLQIGEGAPLKTTDQTGTGNLVLANQPTLYGGYQALETPGTNLYQVNYGANVAMSYWRNSNGNDLLTLDTASGNLTISGGLRVGGGAPLNTTDQTGTGNLVLANQPTLISPNLGTPSIGGGTPIQGHLSVAVPLSAPPVEGNSCAMYPITVAGAREGDSCSLGIPAAWASVANLQFSCAVTAADTVGVKVCNVGTAAAPSLDTAPVRADVWQH